MDNQQEMELQLWEYIDGSLLDAERNAVEKLIADNSFWKQRYHELLDLHQSINLIELEQPSLRFTKNVMDEIARYQIAPATKNLFIVQGMHFQLFLSEEGDAGGSGHGIQPGAEFGSTFKIRQ